MSDVRFIAGPRADASGDARLLEARLRRDVEVAPLVDVGPAAFMQAVTRAWDFAARLVVNRARGRRTCRICGCWEGDACVTMEGQGADRGLTPCGWAADDLCNACEEQG